MRNFAEHKNAVQSSTLVYSNFTWSADKAVDGNKDGRSSPETSKTCSATNASMNGNHTWEVDITYPVLVNSITVYGRSYGDQLSGFQLFIGNVNNSWLSGRLLNATTAADNIHTFQANFSLVRFISVIRRNKEILTLCEVEVNGECEKGTYGYGCNETCGACLNGNDSCSKTNGQCKHGCEEGWRDGTCKQECEKGTYGFGCNETCGACLNGNDSCSKTNGQCKDGCEEGWHDGVCKQECEKGTYGFGCNETCGACLNGNDSCSNTNGQCKDGCEEGWRDGVCKQECENGTYGYGCNETCGSCLYGNDSCSITNGQCKEGCEAGWLEEVCKKKCENGTYGYGCNGTCGKCRHGNNSCSTLDGQCKDGCEAGWREGKCNLECKNGTYGYGCNETCGACLYGNDSCSITNGQCKEGCEAGWRDEGCKKQCENGTYGYGCNGTCGKCLNGNNSCSTLDGQCKDGCEAGWREGKCNLECETGTYGNRCNTTCGNCMNGNELCSKTNGTCINGCQAGWQSHTCTRVADYSKEDNKGIIIGVVTTVIVIVFVAALLIVLRLRRRSNGRSDTEGGWKQKQRVFRKMSEEKKVKELEEISVTEDLVYQNTTQRVKQTGQCISILSFWDHVMKKKAKKEEYESEFQELTQGLTKAHDAALANPSKNRYKSMYPYDSNRVVLKRISPKDSEYEEDTDYINASHIKGYEGRQCYIAAQGPTIKTVDDFWWMVWQERSLLIVMLTNTMEQGKVKCIQYWPDEDERKYGNVLVKMLRNEDFSDYVRRDMQITVGGMSRNVAQFHYKAWPDKDVPDTAWSLVGFWKAVRKYKAYDNCPMIVHCSAGVGRTGTFIALDIIYDEACQTNNVTVMQCVEKLREQRVNMVQTAKQCMFLHDVVAEALGFGTVPVLTNQFSDVFRYLMEKDETSGCSRLERQYNILMNIDLSRDIRNVPIYSNDEEFQFRCIWLPNLSWTDAYVVATGTYSEKFLAFIQQRNIKYIINMDDTSPKNILVALEVNQSETVGEMEITCCGQEDKGGFDRKEFLITDGKKSQNLTMFVLKALEDSQMTPSASSSVLMLLDAVTRCHPGSSGSNPLLFCSSRKVNLCSLMYILLNEKDRIRRDGEIHILRTSTEMIARSRTLLPSFEQYVFLYKCLAADVSPESTYENIAEVRSMNKIL
ncbi:hypothetical protein CHS0354_031572 [Potamilus streckersoni]|uniref:protein-tyrosine-phosphatase n=1 Tax=Potamilus streckersoni TaxID=2493646 RepID=A0AAE0TJ55_9BIVA|nr:hypothetical protein CHS0354_031572 [Potamilus streckersoni]